MEDGIDSVVIVSMNSVHQLLHAGYEGSLLIINIFVVFLWGFWRVGWRLGWDPKINLSSVIVRGDELL